MLANEGLVKSVKKDELYKKLQRDPENIQSATEYRTYRNKLNELIKTTKTNYYMKKIKERKITARYSGKQLRKLMVVNQKIKLKKL